MQLSLILWKDGETFRLLVNPSCVRLVDILEDLTHIEDQVRGQLALKSNSNCTHPIFSINMGEYWFALRELDVGPRLDLLI